MTSVEVPPRGPLLRTREVDVVRDGRYLLRAVSLTVEPGQHWALLGANGAGKSTLLGLLGATTAAGAPGPNPAARRASEPLGTRAAGWRGDGVR
ncbi:ABC-type molybdenum transport system ATPase subunit/photorepair protein PhrA [Kitasatospora sp. GP82]|nr:ABC-type molybdenum transport system ATPase subunit/photorepair protein PhrA [Kitasatospora sp. GP82]